jgi:hypothetical protein
MGKFTIDRQHCSPKKLKLFVGLYIYVLSWKDEGLNRIVKIGKCVNPYKTYHLSEFFVTGGGYKISCRSFFKLLAVTFTDQISESYQKKHQSHTYHHQHGNNNSYAITNTCWLTSSDAFVYDHYHHEQCNQAETFYYYYLIIIINNNHNHNNNNDYRENKGKWNRHCRELS